MAEGGKEPVVCIENFHEPLDCSPKPLRYQLLYIHHRYPVMDHGTYHHVKYCGGEWYPLGDPLVAFEYVSIVAPLSVHHEKVLPVVADNTLYLLFVTVSEENVPNYVTGPKNGADQ